MTFRLVAAVLGTAALAACSTPAQAPKPPLTPPPATTTADVPGVDPAAWFEAYCGPLGVTEVARREIQGKVPEGREAVKAAVVRWASTAAASDRKMADDLEKLGPMSSDVSNPHERLIKSLRDEAKRFDEASTRLAALAADDKFPERYQQVLATSGANESVQMMFKQIVDVPKYKEAFRANKVCADWQKLAGGK
ncbi:hypothetical protein UK23_12200 [Lentzea aerocolonigenes]|uniref:Lipoprotein n=1 Tax=Lentzea aerocolonigenes TaxID=68170 RepID=A0A0F0H6P9_LENAE|nr:hypothetical protein [Lentzea aerocolonigenes]KJK49977.1 hypothetical protein UK23_12200 [Lentzea aerocolonigenes]